MQYVLIALALVFVCFVGVYVLISPDMIDPSQESIDMVQPCGWIFCAGYDAHYAQEVNVPNSQANKNNGEANLDNANAAYVAAQATQMSSETIASQAKVAGIGVWAGFLGALFLGGLAFFGFKIAAGA